MCLIVIFRILQRFFHKTETKFLLALFAKTGPFKIVIKSLTSDITETEVTEELKKKGYEVKHVRQFENSSKKISNSLGHHHIQSYQQTYFQ